MRSLSVILAILVGFQVSLAAERKWNSFGTRFERTLSSLDFDRVDLSPLKSVLVDHDLVVTDSQWDAFVEKNLRYLLFQRLNRNRFLVAPDPQRVVERIAAILRLNRELSRLIFQGRELLQRPELTSEKERVAREIGEIARELREDFIGYFVEIHSGAYTLRLLPTGDVSQQYLYFLLQSEEVNRNLTRQLERYFFNRNPGAIELADYGSASILTLAECLERLSSRVVEKMGEFK